MNALAKPVKTDPLISAALETLSELVPSYARAELEVKIKVLSVMRSELRALEESLARDRRLGECVYQAGWHNAVLSLTLVGMRELSA